MSSYTYTELLYASVGEGIYKSSFTSEAQLNDTTTMGVQAHLPPDFWLPSKGEIGRGILIKAYGILSSTAAPGFTWTIRLGASGSTSGPIILGTAALTAATSVTDKEWMLEGAVIMESVGAAGSNSTVRGCGVVSSPAGLASPFAGELWGGAAATGTVATVDTSIVNYINVNAACTASSASNKIKLSQLLIFGLN